MPALRRWRVLMVVQNNPFPQDGRVRREANTLASGGFQVSIISPKRAGQRWREVVGGVHVYRYPSLVKGNGLFGYLGEYGYSMAATFLLSLLVLLQRGFDVVHAHNPPDTFFLIGAFYKLLGKRFIFDHHDLSPEMYYARFSGDGYRLVYRVLLWLEKASCRLADHVIATNQSYKALEMQRGKVPEARITIVRNGPELDRLRPVEPDPDLRRRGRVMIGYVGEMGIQDGLDYLLRVIRHLVYDLGRSDCFCVLIGSGDAWMALKALASELGLGQHVWFTGHVSDADLVRYLSTADICVDPDPSNPFTDRSTMIKMTEYMAMGKPIVAFDLPEHRVTAQDAAIYARPNDELDFARQIALLADDPERRRKMGQKGKERAETILAWPHQENHLLAAYDALGLRHRRPVAEPTQ